MMYTSYQVGVANEHWNAELAGIRAEYQIVKSAKIDVMQYSTSCIYFVTLQTEQFSLPENSVLKDLCYQTIFSIPQASTIDILVACALGTLNARLTFQKNIK